MARSDRFRRVGNYLHSPTIIIALTIVIVYLVTGAAVSDYANPITTGDLKGNLLVIGLEQCDGPLPILPWTVLTTIFLHANPLHIMSNLLFLLLFGVILEKQITKSQWLTTFFTAGIGGSLGLVALDVFSNFVTGFPSPAAGLDCAVGASGAIYGIMGTAVGLKVMILLIFLLGLNIYGEGLQSAVAHLGGLVVGLILRNYWSLGNRPFRGI